jgi:hypothetical protein
MISFIHLLVFATWLQVGCSTFALTNHRITKNYEKPIPYRKFSFCLYDGLGACSWTALQRTP